MSDGLILLCAAVGLVLLWRMLPSLGFGSKSVWATYDAEAQFSVGRYLVGLEDMDRAVDGMTCLVAPDAFIFLSGTSGPELGFIPRDAVEEVVIDDKSQITQRLTAIRMIALGVFALAAPKKRKISEWCVGIRWVDEKGMRRCTLFEFTGNNAEGAANEAATNLMRFVSRPGADTLALASHSETKVCPYCAETIKAAAIICRFCNRELPRESADSGDS